MFLGLGFYFLKCEGPFSFAQTAGGRCGWTDSLRSKGHPLTHSLVTDWGQNNNNRSVKMTRGKKIRYIFPVGDTVEWQLVTRKREKWPSFNPKRSPSKCVAKTTTNLFVCCVQELTAATESRESLSRFYSGLILIWRFRSHRCRVTTSRTHKHKQAVTLLVHHWSQIYHLQEVTFAPLQQTPCFKHLVRNR